MNEVMQVLKKVVDLPPSQPCNYLLLNLNTKHSGSHNTIDEISKLYLFSEMIKQKHHELRTPQRTPQQISNKRAQNIKFIRIKSYHSHTFILVLGT